MAFTAPSTKSVAFERPSTSNYVAVKAPTANAVAFARPTTSGDGTIAADSALDTVAPVLNSVANKSTLRMNAEGIGLIVDDDIAKPVLGSEAVRREGGAEWRRRWYGRLERNWKRRSGGFRQIDRNRAGDFSEWLTRGTYRSTALGSVAAIYWVLLLHCSVFWWIIERLGSVGSGRIYHPHLYMYTGAERNWYFILYIILAGQNQTIIRVPATHPHPLLSTFLSLSFSTSGLA